MRAMVFCISQNQSWRHTVLLSGCLCGSKDESQQVVQHFAPTGIKQTGRCTLSKGPHCSRANVSKKIRSYGEFDRLGVISAHFSKGGTTTVAHLVEHRLDTDG